jgi:hypothetical protein
MCRRPAYRAGGLSELERLHRSKLGQSRPMVGSIVNNLAGSGRTWTPSRCSLGKAYGRSIMPDELGVFKAAVRTYLDGLPECTILRRF